MEKRVGDYPDYGITSCGRVYSYKTNRWLKTYIAKNGYEQAVFSDGTHHFIHRLVAEAFLDNTDNLPVVNHKNGIRNDNRLSNLEWTTQGDNVCMAIGIPVIIDGIEYPSLSQARKSTKLSWQKIYKCLERNQ